MDLNHVFANHSDKEEIYPLTVSEIAEEQTKDKSLQQLLAEEDMYCLQGRSTILEGSAPEWREMIQGTF